MNKHVSSPSLDSSDGTGLLRSERPDIRLDAGDEGSVLRHGERALLDL